MSIRYIIFVYIIIPILVAELTYASLLDLVGEVLAITAGCCMAFLLGLVFLLNFGKPIHWK